MADTVVAVAETGGGEETAAPKVKRVRFDPQFLDESYSEVSSEKDSSLNTATASEDDDSDSGDSDSDVDSESHRISDDNSEDEDVGGGHEMVNKSFKSEEEGEMEPATGGSEDARGQSLDAGNVRENRKDYNADVVQDVHDDEKVEDEVDDGQMHNKYSSGKLKEDIEIDRHILREIMNEPKDIEEVEPFSEFVNPLRLLADIDYKLKKNYDLMKDRLLADTHQDGTCKNILDEVKDAKGVIKKSLRFVKDFENHVLKLRNTMQTMARSLKEKVRKEHVSFDEGDRLAKDELEARHKVISSHAEYVQIATDLTQLQKLGLIIDESCKRIQAELLKMTMEQQQLDQISEEAAEKGEKELQEKILREKEEEERRIKEEAARRQKEEVERQRKAEEAERQRQEEIRKQFFLQEENVNVDPRTWPVFIYKAHLPEEDFEGNIACVVRARPGLLEKMQLECFISTEVAPPGATAGGETEELISHVVTVRSKGDPVQLDSPVWLAIPRVQIKGAPHKAPQLLRRTTDGAWHELASRDTVIPTIKDVKFCETPLTVVDSVTLVVTHRLKAFNQHVNARGGRLVCTFEPRAFVHVPRGTYRVGADLQLKLMVIDANHIQELRARNPACEPLQGTSGLAHVNCTSKSSRPVLLSLPSPTGTVKKRPQSVVVCRRGSGHQEGASVTPQPPNRPRSAWGGMAKEDAKMRACDSLSLVGRARHAAGAEWEEIHVPLTVQRDVIQFEMDNIDEYDRLIILRVKSDTEPEVLPGIAQVLESSLAERVVNMVVRQKENDMESVYIDIMKKDSVGKLLAKLKENEYSYGPPVSQDYVLREGQEVEINLRGNLKFHGLQTPFQLVFHSYLRTARKQVFITEEDRYAQHALEFYRGHVQFYSGRATYGGHMLCETPLTLPKPPIEHVSIRRAPVVFQEKGPFTWEYFELLSQHLGEEWKVLGDHLGLNKARVQGIIRDNAAEVKEDHQHMKNVQDMLVCWYKSCAMSADKVVDLYWALRDTGREDLAMDLYERNIEFHTLSEERAEADRFRRAFKMVLESPVALREWKMLGRFLGLEESLVQDIEKKYAHSKIERCLNILNSWRMKRGKTATMRKLVRTLGVMKMRDIAEKVSHIK